MVQSQYSLSWNSYKTSICNGFSSLQQNAELVDMTIAADGHFVKVHQVLMALSSPYLKELITSAPGQHPILFLNNVSHKTLSLLLEYIYTGEVLVPSDGFASFGEAARALHIKGLENITSTDNFNPKMATNMPQIEQNLCHASGIKRLAVPTSDGTEQISLPAAARKIYIKQDMTPYTTKTEVQSTFKDDTHDYTDMMEDSAIQDSDEDAAQPTSNKKLVIEAKPSSNLQFTVSIRGSLQVILNRYIYNLHSVTHRTGVRRWRCVDYRNNKCMAFVVTKDNIVLNRANLHNHSFHDKKILTKIEKKAVYSALDDVKGYKEKMMESESSIEHDGTMVDFNESINSLYYLFESMLPVRFLCIIFGLHAILANPLPKNYPSQCYHEIPAIKRFQEYIQIDTSQENNIHFAVEFWRRQANELGLPFAVHRPTGKPVCVITWEGSNTTLPSIMLNSHMDVVTVYETDWTYPPFAGHIDDNGNLYGRGTQDTKDIAIQYLEAIRKLRNNNVTLERTFHLTLMPDEETGGFNGMIPFAETAEFEALNVGFALDEGLVSSADYFFATYQDKRPWTMKFKLNGPSGHGSVLSNGSAVEKLQKLISIIIQFRTEQEERMAANNALDYGSYNTININIIQGGLASNIVPTDIKTVIDMRLATSADAEAMLDLVKNWAEQAGNGTELTFARYVTESAATPLDGNKYWVAMKEAINNMGIQITPVVCPGTTDMVVMRNKGIPAIGFAPITHTKSNVNGSNEYLNVDTFLNGIDVYVAILQKLGNLQLKLQLKVM
ncbi:aminoacylase-1-like [Galleria mellonella]|uniref:N-acyl-aliphatic-L-amino acid amidohydrolase n=1 Tax=Galleria mellonella TaxID=7137 RepID=A0ABM3MXV9_GALME|nr:aminoacylase-1-like [Galleria mellonella]